MQVNSILGQCTKLWKKTVSWTHLISSSGPSTGRRQRRRLPPTCAVHHDAAARHGRQFRRGLDADSRHRTAPTDCAVAAAVIAAARRKTPAAPAPWGRVNWPRNYRRRRAAWNNTRTAPMNTGDCDAPRQRRHFPGDFRYCYCRSKNIHISGPWIEITMAGKNNPFPGFFLPCSKCCQCWMSCEFLRAFPVTPRETERDCEEPRKLTPFSTPGSNTLGRW